MHTGKYHSVFPMINMLNSIKCSLVHPQNFQGCSCNKQKAVLKYDKFDKIEYFKNKIHKLHIFTILM